eukprot:5974582-Prymnesium_polylepis.1
MPSTYSDSLTSVVRACLVQQPAKRPTVSSLLAGHGILHDRAERYAYEMRMNKAGYHLPSKVPARTGGAAVAEAVAGAYEAPERGAAPPPQRAPPRRHRAAVSL